MERLIVVHDATDNLQHVKNLFIDDPQSSEKKIQRPLTHKELEVFKKRNYRITVVAKLRADNTITAGIACCSGAQQFHHEFGEVKAKMRLKEIPNLIGSITGNYTGSKTDQHARIVKATKLVKQYAREIRKKVCAENRRSSISRLIMIKK